jgi:hypothetical protein
MTYEAAYEAARRLSVSQTRTTYVLRLPRMDGPDTYGWCTVGKWQKRHADGWKYVTQVTEESEPYSEAFATA